MRQRPILFNGAMVRALLDGSKTQTRRLFKVHGWTTEQMSKYEFVDVLQACETGELALRQPVTEAYAGFKLSPDAEYPAYFKCPFGTIGDQLWVRETFMDLRGTGVEHRTDPRGILQRYAYQADTPPGTYGDEARKDYGLKWSPSIHMPRAASRIALEITDIRVERLQDISEDDAKAEGFDNSKSPAAIEAGWYETPRPAFLRKWGHIYGDESLKGNPWVWVIEFKRVTA